MPDPKVSPTTNQPHQRDAILRNAEFDWGNSYRTTSPLPLKHRIPKRPRPSGKANTPSQNRAGGTALASTPATQVAEKRVEAKATATLPAPEIATPPRPADRLETEQLLPISGTIRTISPLQAKEAKAPAVIEAPSPIVPAPTVIGSSVTLVPEPIEEPAPVVASTPVEPEHLPVVEAAPIIEEEIDPIETVPVASESVVIEPTVIELVATEPIVVESVVIDEPAPIIDAESSNERAVSTGLKLEEQPGLAAIRSVSESAPNFEDEPAPSAPLYYKNTPVSNRSQPDRTQPVESQQVKSKPNRPPQDRSPAVRPQQDQPVSNRSTSDRPQTDRPQLTQSQPDPSQTSVPAKSPMKSSSPYSPSPISSPSVKSGGPGSSSATRNPGIPDYKGNIERQSREQKSVGSLLSIIVYTLVAVLLLGGGLAGYGLYVLKQQIAGQSVTIGDLQRNFSNKTDALQKNLDSTTETLNQALSQMNRQNDMLVQQEDEINKLIKINQDQSAALTAANASINTEAAALNRERAVRINGVDDLKSEIRHLDNRVSELHEAEVRAAAKTEKTEPTSTR